MTISRPQETLVDFTNSTSTRERFSSTFFPHPSAQQVVVQYSSTEAGTLNVDFQAPDGSWNQFESISVSANTPGVTTYLFNTGPLRVRFTPDAQPVSAYVITRYAGYAGGLA